jgi:flagellar hook-length control protein FliK
MTTDLFFMPAQSPQTPSSFQGDKTGSISSDPPSKTEPRGLSKDDKHENFLTTLKNVSRDRKPSEKSQPPASHAATRPDRTDPPRRIEKEIDFESTGDDVLIDIMSLLRLQEAPLSDQVPVAAELKMLIARLEQLGLNGSSGAQMLQFGEGLKAGNVQDHLAALRQLITEIQNNGFKPGNDLSTGLERLQQFIANALGTETADHGHNISKDGLNLSQPPGSFDIANWAKGISQGLEHADSINSAKLGEGSGGEKPAEILAAMTRTAMGPGNISQETGSIKAVENSQMPLPSENSEKTDAAKPNIDMRAAADVNITAKDAKVLENSSGNGPLSDDETEMTGKAGNSNRNAYLNRLLSSADSGQRSGGEAQQENSLTGDSSPVSRLLNDVQVEKESPLKVETTLADDAGSKVVKLEAGSNDSGHLTSQNQSSEKTFETTSATKEAEAGQQELRTRTMEQIVRRAVIQVREGQHEARIDLKPDFLGHVRMQVITDNQLVTVKILTEFGFVKDMIENNIHQLKADLQQQGLDVDKVDVSVSRDTDGNKHSQENADRAKNQRQETDNTDGENTGEKDQEPKEHTPINAEGFSTVDYFA